MLAKNKIDQNRHTCIATIRVKGRVEIFLDERSVESKKILPDLDTFNAPKHSPAGGNKLNCSPRLTPSDIGLGEGVRPHLFLKGR